MKQKPLNIILLGDPAAGKATQSALLVKKFGLFDFDMGKELRILRETDKTMKKLLQATYDQGKVTQTKIVRKILHDKIHKTPKAKGILFDGHPKMLGEAKLAMKWLKQESRREPIVLYLSIPFDEMIKRMSDRREYFKGKFSRRTDDNAQALKNRMRYYRKNIADVIEFLSPRYPYKKISGLGSVAEVHKRLMKAVEELQ